MFMLYHYDVELKCRFWIPGGFCRGGSRGGIHVFFMPIARYVDLLPNYCMPFSFIIPEDYSRYDMIIGGRPVFLLRAILIVPFF